jgi:integrase
MSVRKRRWYSRTDAKERARALAQEAGQGAAWKDYLKAAKAALKADPPREAWIVDYFVGKSRHMKTFAKKKEADAYHATVSVAVANGTHTAPSKSITVAEAARLWLDFVTGRGRERATLVFYEQHVRIHINPRLGHFKLATLSAPHVEAFCDDLIRSKVSKPTARKVLTSLKSMLRHAQRHGKVAQNVALAVKIDRDKRHEGKLTVGEDIPTREDIRHLIDAAPTLRARAVLFVAAFAGLRASEIRGLRWTDVDLKSRQATITVDQRADRYGTIGSTKSATSRRTVPIAGMVANTLREWRLQCPPGPLGLVFPTAVGAVQSLNNLARQALEEPQRRIGMVDGQGKPRYAIHALRHYYASWCINRKADGGLELPLKNVSAMLGHSSVGITADRYGHLFPRSDDSESLDAAVSAIFATHPQHTAKYGNDFNESRRV